MNPMLHHQDLYREAVDRRHWEAREARQASLGREARRRHRHIARPRWPEHLVALGGPIMALLAIGAALVLI